MCEASVHVVPADAMWIFRGSAFEDWRHPNGVGHVLVSWNERIWNEPRQPALCKKHTKICFRVLLFQQKRLAGWMSILAMIDTYSIMFPNVSVLCQVVHEAAKQKLTVFTSNFLLIKIHAQLNLAWGSNTRFCSSQFTAGQIEHKNIKQKNLKRNPIQPSVRSFVHMFHIHLKLYDVYIYISKLWSQAAQFGLHFQQCVCPYFFHVLDGVCFHTIF